MESINNKQDIVTQLQTNIIIIKSWGKLFWISIEKKKGSLNIIDKKHQECVGAGASYI